jgi:hypothetical protein
MGDGINKNSLGGERGLNWGIKINFSSLSPTPCYSLQKQQEARGILPCFHRIGGW